MKPREIRTLIFAIVIPQAAGIIGSFFTIPSISMWYAGLAKSRLNPPGWVFGPVWTTLFLLMGIALFLVWRRREKDPKHVDPALALFGTQLVLNVLWSVLFFGLHDPAFAVSEIVVLWLAILATIVSFFRISRPAAYLLVPYLLWVTFASYLNLSVVLLNP